jgi:TatD DNase family protein
MLVDSHAHLDYIVRGTDDQPGQDPAEVLARGAELGLGWMVNPSVTPKRFDEVMAMAERFDNVYAAVAVHPTDVEDTLECPDWQAEVETLIQHPKVVALGETGLDYYWDKTHVDLQKQCFKTFLDLGVKHNLPVIVHDRDAHEDVYALIAETPGIRGVMHCFSGDVDFALRMIELGFYISFAGNVTFKKALELQEAAKAIPLEWLLIETDSPFLSPVPFRGKPNEPGRVRYVAEFIAELRGIPLEAIAEQTTANAHQLFGIPV